MNRIDDRPRGRLMVLLVALCVGAPTVAEVGDASPPGAGSEVDVTIPAPPPSMMTNVAMARFGAISMWPLSDDTTTGAPYSATSVTEVEQRLWDGNRIWHRSETEVYRDGRGRVRREEQTELNPEISPTELPVTSVITDPDSGTTYILDHGARTVQVLPLPTFDVAHGGATAGVAVRSIAVATRAPGPGPGLQPPTVAFGAMAAYAGPIAGEVSLEESLGVQKFDGVEAEGSRTTTTIPAGAIGTELPIEIVSETWRSRELGLVVMSRQTDPRFGETVHRLEHLRLGEPAVALFEIPEDYVRLEAQTHGARAVFHAQGGLESVPAP